MIVLGLDTCLSACSVAVIDGDRVLASRREPMTRGHQERLAPLVAEVMAEAGLGFDRLDRIGVTVGPGSFTGLRVGIAFAKGLSTALGVPAVGIGALEALAATAPKGLTVAAIDARRGQIYFQAFSDTVALSDPEAFSLDDAMTRLAVLGCEGPVAILGSAAQALAGRASDGPEAPDPADIARLAAARALSPLQPLYLRPPDARPSAA